MRPPALAIAILTAAAVAAFSTSPARGAGDGPASLSIVERSIPELQAALAAVFAEHRLEALLDPANWGAAMAAKAGYPSVIVPAGTFPNAPDPALPEGFDAKPSPMGVTFTGLACSEPRLLALAYAFEQATMRRVPPPELP